MQPPPSRGRGAGAPPGGGAAEDPIVERIRAWARRPIADDTVTLCDELRVSREVRGNHVDALARAVMQRHAKDPRVLLSLGRLQLATGKLSDAQQTLVTAGRLDPNARGPYRYLGEVLLRRGDASRAEKMLEKSVELERRGAAADPGEEPSDEWLSRARTLRALQDRAGEGAVAAEVANLLSRAPVSRRGSPVRSSLRPPTPIHAESDDQPTQVGAIPDELRKQAVRGNTQYGARNAPAPFDEEATRTDTTGAAAARAPAAQSSLPPPPNVPPAPRLPPLSLPSTPAPQPPVGAQAAQPRQGALRPQPTPPPIPSALRPQPTPPPPVAGALRPQPTPPPLPPSRPPPRGASMPDVAHASSFAPIEEYSDATTLPRADEHSDPGAMVETSEIFLDQPMPTRGDMLASGNPTVRQDYSELESVPHLAAVPPAGDDLSPPPQQNPTHTGRLRALRAESITLGEDSLGERRDEKFATKKVRTRPPSPSSAPGDPFSGFDGAPSSRNGARAESAQFAQNPAFAGDAPAPGEAWEPHRVLGALERAGIYEPTAAASSPAQWMSRREIPRTRRRGGWLYALLAVVILGGIGGAIYGTQVLKQKHQQEAEDATLRAEAAVHKAGLESLAAAEKDLGRAFELDSRTLRGAKVWLQDRVLRSQLWPSENRKEGGLASAIERGKTVGLQEPDLAFARIALALSSDDTPSAAALAKTLDPGTAKGKDDAWRELAVGWVLERAGDARAIERYAHAVELDPDLAAAKLALAKMAALSGDSDKVESLTKDFVPDLGSTRDDLVALAKLVKTGATAKGGAAGPRRPEGLGWILPALVVADTAAAPDVRKKEAAHAFSLAHEPGDLVRVGRLAAAAGDDATASKAALRALEVSPIFPPARALAARLALGVGRPDDAARALDGLVAEGDPEVAALRAWLAYERGDLSAVAQQIDDPIVSASLDRPDLAAIVKPLRFAVATSKKSALSNKDKDELASIAKMGELGPLVAFDVALSAEDLETADAIGKAFGDVSQRPARAMRLAKLARLAGKAEDADKYSKIAIEQGTVTEGALVERVLVLGGIGKGGEALTLLGRYPLLAADEQPWLRAWASAQAGKVAEAKKSVDGLKDPDKKASWAVKRDALLAIAATDTKRAKPMAKELLKERPNDRDVQAVAKSLALTK